MGFLLCKILRYLTAGIIYGKSSAFFSKNLRQCTAAAGMAPDNVRLDSLGLGHGATDHFMRHRIGKKHYQIRASDFFFQITGHLRKHFSFALILLTYLFILAGHTIVAADNYNAHFIFSYSDSKGWPHKQFLFYLAPASLFAFRLPASREGQNSR